MFDRTVFVGGGTKHVTENRTVTEHRAPTDESVRLLTEMEEAARKRIVDRFVSEAGDNRIGVVEMYEACDTMTRRVAFSINGRRIDVRLDRHYSTGVQGIADAMAQQILQQIVSMIDLRRVV